MPLRPWRTAALVASAVAVVELVALVAIGVALLSRPVADRVREAAETQAFAPAPKPKAKAKAAPARKAAAPPTLPRGETSVLVLNGNGRAGAAGAAADIVKRRGYIVAGATNAPRTDYPRTFVMYRKGREAEARRLARDLGAKVVGPLDGISPSKLLGAHLALVLGAR